MITRKYLTLSSMIIIIAIPILLFVFEYFDLFYTHSDFDNHFILLYLPLTYTSIFLLVLSFIEQTKTRIKVFVIVSAIPLVFSMGGLIGIGIMFFMFSFSCFTVFGLSTILLSLKNISKPKIAVIATVLSLIMPLYGYIDWFVFGTSLFGGS